MKIIPIMTWICRLLVGGVFLASSVPKIVAPGRFFTQVMGYGVVGTDAATGVASFLPWVELVLGLALISGVMATGGFLLSTILLLSFTVLQGWAMFQGLEIGCGCFTLPNEADPISAWTVSRTFLMAMLSLVGWWGFTRSTRQSNTSEASLEDIVETTAEEVPCAPTVG